MNLRARNLIGPFTVEDAWKEASGLADELAQVLPADPVRRLRRIVGDGRSREITAAVVGNFNAGKSTLLNRLIGQFLLPTHDLTETGAVVRLRAGPMLQASATTASGVTREIEATTEGLREVSSILDAEGDRRSANGLARHVDIVVPSKLLPSRLTLMDMPGFGDRPEVDELVIESASAADHVIFLFRSDVFLSESEIRLMTRLLENRVPDSLHLVVNCILHDPSDEHWTRFQREVLPVHLKRLAAHHAAIGFPDDQAARLRVIRATTVRGAPNHGLEEFQQFLHTMSDVPALRLPVQRLVRLNAFLKEQGSRLGAQTQLLARELAERSAEAARQAQHSIAQRECGEQIKRLVAEAVERFAAEVRLYVGRAEAAVAPSALVRDSSHGDNLQKAVSAVGNLEPSRLMDEVAQVIRKLLDTSIDSPNTKAQRLSNYFAITTAPVPVPNHPVEQGAGFKSGAAAGMAIGTMLPVVGTFFGGFIGGIAGAVNQSRMLQQAIEADVTGLRYNIRSAGEKAIEALRARRPGIEDIFDSSPLFFAEPVDPALAAGLPRLHGRHQQFAASLQRLQCLAQDVSILLRGQGVSA